MYNVLVFVENMGVASTFNSELFFALVFPIAQGCLLKRREQELLAAEVDLLTRQLPLTRDDNRQGQGSVCKLVAIV